MVKLHLSRCTILELKGGDSDPEESVVLLEFSFFQNHLPWTSSKQIPVKGDLLSSRVVILVFALSILLFKS